MTHGYNGEPILPDATVFETIYGDRGVGAAEMAWAIRKGRPHRLSGEYGLHCMEVLCGMEQAAADGGTYRPQSRFDMRPLAPGYYLKMADGSRADAERSIID